MKSEIYTALHVINQASEEIVRQLEKLRDQRVLTPDFAELNALGFRHHCADVNVSVTHHLATAGVAEAYELERELLEKQRKLSEGDAT